MPPPIRISLTTFVDFLLAAGLAKLTVVRRAKKLYAAPYEPKKDFWGPLRKGIVDMHEKDAKPSTLNQLLHELSDVKKRRRYPPCINAYQRWLGRKTTKWTGAASVTWQHENLIVTINPELGILVDGNPHRIKLYFKGEALTKRRTQVMLHLLRITAPGAKTLMGLLDVPGGKLLPLDNPVPGIDGLLQGEARSFIAIWNAL